MEAIFIQSYFGEFCNGPKDRGFLFLENLFKTVSGKRPVILFLGGGGFLDLNIKNYDILNNIKSIYPNIKIVVVDDFFYRNPTSGVFSFLMNYKVDLYKKILILEADCFLIEGFDAAIFNEVSRLSDSDWFIFGSAYFGKSTGHGSSAQHMNGVAVYNRSSHFNQTFLNFLKDSNILQGCTVNYDYFFYKYLVGKNKFEKYCIDSDLILNISAAGDSELNWTKIKNKAVVIHTKDTALAATFLND